MLTFNGNENILQNDMGNAQVMDAKTGNMIGLSDGFVPVGIKEHGGVIYIASYNPKTQEGELGSIPSPRISYSLQDTYDQKLNTQLTNVNTEDIIIDNKILQNYIPVDDKTLFRVGDQFMIELDLSFLENWITGEQLLTSKSKKGLYTLSLYSKTISGTYVPIDLTGYKQSYYLIGNDSLQTSEYWFVKKDGNIDIDRTYKKSNLLITYPNIPSGFLYLKINIEKPKDINIIKNNSNNINCPIYFIL